MKLKTLLIINTVIAFVFGISFLLLPAMTVGLYGVASSPGIILEGRLFGLTMIGIGLICWLSREVTDRGAQRAIILAQLVSTLLGFIVVLLAIIAGVVNAAGWLSVVIYLFLALGFAYFQFMKPKGS